jgi:hypothetical protein
MAEAAAVNCLCSALSLSYLKAPAGDLEPIVGRHFGLPPFQELSPFSRLEMLEQINGNRFYL